MIKNVCKVYCVDKVGWQLFVYGFFFICTHKGREVKYKNGMKRIENNSFGRSIGISIWYTKEL